MFAEYGLWGTILFILVVTFAVGVPGAIIFLLVRALMKHLNRAK